MLTIHIKRWPYVEWKRETLSSPAIGWISLGVMVVAASTYNSFAKTLTDSLSPMTLVCLSELLTAFFVLFSFGALPMVRKMFTLRDSFLLPMFAIGILSGVIAPLLWFAGLHQTTAVNAALFGNAEMIFFAFFGVVILREAFGRVHLLSTLTMIAGLVFIVLRGFTEGIHLQNGDILLTLSCFTFALGDLIFRKCLQRSDPQVVILIRSITAISGFFLISPFLDMPLIHEIRAFPLSSVPALLGFAFVSRFLNGFSFYEALEHLPVMTVSLTQNLTVIGSIAFAAWYLGEPLHPYHFIGGALIVAGALMLEMAGMHPSDQHLERQLKQSHSNGA